jgi:hypothetical protein
MSIFLDIVRQSWQDGTHAILPSVLIRHLQNAFPKGVFESIQDELNSLRGQIFRRDLDEEGENEDDINELVFEEIRRRRTCLQQQHYTFFNMHPRELSEDIGFIMEMNSALHTTISQKRTEYFQLMTDELGVNAHLPVYLRICDNTQEQHHFSSFIYNENSALAVALRAHAVNIARLLLEQHYVDPNDGVISFFIPVPTSEFQSKVGDKCSRRNPMQILFSQALLTLGEWTEDEVLLIFGLLLESRGPRGNTPLRIMPYDVTSAFQYVVGFTIGPGDQMRRLHPRTFQSLIDARAYDYADHTDIMDILSTAYDNCVSPEDVETKTILSDWIRLLLTVGVKYRDTRRTADQRNLEKEALITARIQAILWPLQQINRAHNLGFAYMNAYFVDSENPKPTLIENRELISSLVAPFLNHPLGGAPRSTGTRTFTEVL